MASTVDGGGNRLRWRDAPAALRAAVEGRFGPVVDEVSMPGGFTPGMASVLRLADGGAVFVKAVSADLTPAGPRVYRREIEVASSLPEQVPSPRLLWSHDDGGWVALGFEHVPGRPPDVAVPDELEAVLAAATRLAEALDPSPVPLAPVTEVFADLLVGWRSLASSRPDPGGSTLADLDPALPDALSGLAAVEAGWSDAMAGTALVHGDLRPDNMLLTADGSVQVVDWPQACVGARWVDLVLMLPSLALRGVSPQQVVTTHPLTRDVDPDRLDVVITALAGYFVSQCLQPPPRGLPTVRAFQRAQGVTALSWLRARGRLAG